MKSVKIDKCAACGKNRVLYSRLGVKINETIYSLDSQQPCCQKCFEKEAKKQLKEGALVE